MKDIKIEKLKEENKRLKEENNKLKNILFLLKNEIINSLKNK